MGIDGQWSCGIIIILGVPGNSKTLIQARATIAVVNNALDVGEAVIVIPVLHSHSA
jgi:hypothetical protein